MLDQYIISPFQSSFVPGNLAIMAWEHIAKAWPRFQRHGNALQKGVGMPSEGVATRSKECEHLAVRRGNAY